MQLSLELEATESSSPPRRPRGPQRLQLLATGAATVEPATRVQPEHAALACDAILERKTLWYIDQALTDATRTAYEGDMRAFTKWCAARGWSALPASEATLARYLTDLAVRGRKASTIRRARIAIGLEHADKKLPRPDQTEGIRKLEHGIGRVHGTREVGPDPLLHDQLRTVTSTLGHSVRGVRDRALILVGFGGAFRASVLAAMQIEHLTFTPQGVDIFVPRSKEDQLGRGRTAEVPCGSDALTCPVRALRDWLALLGRARGPLFATVRGSKIEQRAMHPRAAARAVQRATAAAGLQGHYAAHSLRSGLATSADALGHTASAIRAHGGWLDTRSVYRYIRPERVPDRTNVAAGLL